MVFTKPRTFTLKRSLYLKSIGNCDMFIVNTLNNMTNLQGGKKKLFKMKNVQNFINTFQIQQNMKNQNTFV